MFDVGGIIDTFLAKVMVEAGVFWAPVVPWILLGKWYLIGLGLILMFAGIGWFWQRSRPYMGVLAAIVVAFLAGATKMFIAMRTTKPVKSGPKPKAKPPEKEFFHFPFI